MKLVINKRYGGFGLSMRAAEWLRDRGHPAAVAEFAERAGYDAKERAQGGMSKAARGLSAGWLDPNGFMGSSWHFSELERNDPLLVQCVEELGEAANGAYANLVIVEIPDGVEFEIEEYDGNEWVAEAHRTWR